MSRRGDEDDDFATDDDEFAGLSVASLHGEDVLLGMQVDEELSAVLINADEEETKRLREAQDADDFMHEVKQFVASKEDFPSSYDGWYKRNRPKFVIKDGVLYRRCYRPDVLTKVLQAVIPTSMIPEVIKDFHGRLGPVTQKARSC